MSPATVYVYPLWEQNLRSFGPSAPSTNFSH